MTPRRRLSGLRPARRPPCSRRGAGTLGTLAAGRQLGGARARALGPHRRVSGRLGRSQAPAKRRDSRRERDCDLTLP